MRLRCVWGEGGLEYYPGDLHLEETKSQDKSNVISNVRTSGLAIKIQKIQLYLDIRWKHQLICSVSLSQFNWLACISFDSCR